MFLDEMFQVLIFPRRQRCGAGVESTMKFITPSYIRRLADESTQYPALLAVSTTRPISSYFMKVCKNRCVKDEYYILFESVIERKGDLYR